MSSQENNEKDTKDDSVNDLTLKLQNRFNVLKKILFGSIALIVFDILIMILIPSVFCNLFNISSLIIISFSIIFSFLLFRYNLQPVSYIVYKSTNRVKIYLIISMVFYYLDMFYILLWRILLDIDNMNTTFYKGFNIVFFSILIFFVYFMINMGVPMLMLYKLNQVKATIKELGQAQGESYDSIPSIDPVPNVEIVESVN